MILHQWAIKHGIPLAAVHELQQLMGVRDTDAAPPPMGAVSEAAIQAKCRLDASREGGRLWRNNVGALLDQRNRLIRYGLCNDSAQLNSVLKSADLIGIRPVLITPEHVGTTIGQFDSVECKASNWRYSDTREEQAQLAWAQLITSLGGRARFVNK
jgi:hypothetical protein